ncbi:MAG: hypothetical protein ACOCX3_01715 [Chloroflexota bacterium]
MHVAIDPQTIEILVTGMPEAGKSTFVRTISKRTETTNGWLTGSIRVEENLRLRLIEPPHIEQFDFLSLRELIESVDVAGFIIVCDSTRPEYFGALIGLLETIHFNHEEAPMIVVTNHPDAPGAWGADDIRLGLNIPNFIDVMACDVQRVEEVKNVVLRLLMRIIG